MVIKRSNAVCRTWTARIGAACCTVLFSACPTVGNADSAGAVPIEIPYTKDSQFFPLRAAGYTRGRILVYEPMSRNCSVAYDRDDAELRSSVTLYLLPRERTADAEYAASKASILQLHAGAEIASEKHIELEKHGRSYPALAATFAFSDSLNGTGQPVSSDLVVIELPNRLVKVRTTAPREQRARADEALLALLEQLGWDHDPNDGSVMEAPSSTNAQH